MDATHEAKEAMHAIAQRVAPVEQRELLSHLYEGAGEHAQRMGRERIEVVDVDAAVAAAGGAARLAATFSRRARAPIARRAAAHGLDVLIVSGGTLLLWGLLWVVARVIAGAMGADFGWERPDPFQLVDFDDIPGPTEWRNGVPVASALNGALVGLFVLVLPFVYFLAGDRAGRTLGKRALGLRAVQGRGRVGWLAAAVRALMKASVLLAPVLLVDALFGRGGRWSDHALGVDVVDERAGIDEPATGDMREACA